MLGDGIVSFGLAVVVSDFRYSNASPKIVSLTPSLPSMCSAAGVNSIVPCSLRNSTLRLPGAVDTPSSW